MMDCHSTVNTFSIINDLNNDLHLGMLLIRNFKFRLYPNHSEEEQLEKNLSVCRWVYNKMIEFLQKNKTNLSSRNDLNYFLTELKESEPWLYSYHSKMLQMISTQIFAAQKALIQLQKNGHKTGPLKFSRRDDFRTLVYSQSGFAIIRRGNTDLLQLSKIGFISLRKHRNVVGNIKQAIITKSKSGKWYVCLTVDLDTTIQQIIHIKPVGTDVGIKNFSYDSEGFVTSNPLNLKKMLKPLRRVQRKLSRRQKGSRNRRKAIKFYRIIHERIHNRRKDFLHKLSTYYAKNYDLVFIEKLQKLNMMKNHSLARNILDSSWGVFTNMLNYKCTKIEVPAFNTSINCSKCGTKIRKTLAIRIHNCNVCNLVLDRDHNAAINILKKGLEITKLGLPQELRELTSVEIAKRSMKQKNTTGIVW